MALMIVIVLGVTLVFCWLSCWLVPWSVHRAQTIRYSDTWGYGSRAQFEGQFNSIPWERLVTWPNSFFHRASDSEIHASIIRFRGHGMVILPWDWPAVSWKLRRSRLTRRNYQPWDEPQRATPVEPR